MSNFHYGFNGYDRKSWNDCSISPVLRIHELSGTVCRLFTSIYIHFAFRNYIGWQKSKNKLFIQIINLSLNTMLSTILLQAAGMGVAKMGATIGAGLAAIGAGIGIGLIGKGAVEAIGRQPSAAGEIRTSMLIMSALVEGVALFAIVVCFLALFQ